MAKKKVHKLSLNFEQDYHLVGIASHENDYRLSWAINNALGVKLIKVKDLLVLNPKHKIEINYTMFSYTDDVNHIDYFLISNKSEKGFLLPGLKNIDFIMKIAGDPDIDFIHKIIPQLKKIDIIITAYLLEELPDKFNKLFAF